MDDRIKTLIRNIILIVVIILLLFNWRDLVHGFRDGWNAGVSNHAK